jgi:hypothetical protein
MKKDRICKYCNQIFKDIEGRIFSNHVKYCPQNIKSSYSNKKEYSKKFTKCGPITTLKVFGPIK